MQSKKTLKLKSSMSKFMKKILVTCGDPSGIGPDLCVNLAFKSFYAQITIVGSSKVISERAQILKKKYHSIVIILNIMV